MTPTSSWPAGGALRHPALKVLVLLLTGVFIAWALHGQWAEMRASARDLRVEWRWIAAASATVLAVYALLIQSWRVLLRGWGGDLPYPAAVRIWTIANLGRWIPGKVWSVGALSVLAAREGVSGTAAAGAAVLGTLLNIGAGFGIGVIMGAEGLDTVYPGFRTGAMVATAVFLAGVLALPRLLPPVLGWFAAKRGVPMASKQLSASTLWAAAAMNAASWLGYGLAFALFSRGVTPRISSDPALFIAVFTASYLIGYLVLFSPGGLGFREAALTVFLVGVGAAGQGDAVILGVTSRVWLTVLEVLPGLVSLLFLPASQRAALQHPSSLLDGPH
ncbi:lysylphosphatidylglycerol synthase domain-containing protein [Gemmatimonas sp.]|uniref:lysylphosphatidylglycerol synthase domain-containing protein n=1 Tax=Gemmatimonas sp. TaxID=1962908 RepID=UPI00286DF0F6|nr:lysylphosphatidylglycerol synthase domain-containing protein [Gemmatimonas sp.]